MYYRAIAMRDIKPGEEVTCDYALFDYHCNGHEIEVCACGSHKCRGKMLGFQGKKCYN
jgi:SET domain-containing protein